MATAELPDNLVEDLVCAVCLDLFKEPVLLQCGHNFCKSCIDKVWDREKTAFCPVCREEYPARNYILNKILCKLVQAAQRSQPGENAGKLHEKQQTQLYVFGSHECSEHRETLNLFCQQDERPICLVCMLSAKHTGHTFLPLREAVSMFQDELKADASILESYMNELKESQSKQELKISAIQVKTQNLEQHITSEFAKLHQFLKDKEQQLIQQLYEEATGLLGKMKEKLSKIEKTKDDIQKLVSDIQLKVQQEDPLLFLTDIVNKAKRVRKSLKEVEETEEKQKEGAEKDETEDESDSVLASSTLSLGVYKGPLQYRIWKEMLSFISPGLSRLTFDPNTACSHLILSDHLTSVRYDDVKQQLPDNPERFDVYPCVLGSEGFASGRHYWEVEVKNMFDWDIGITRESGTRKGGFSINPGDGYWVISLRGGNTYLAQDSPCKTLSLSVNPNRIGVYLDYEGGQVSFYDADNMSHLHTFTDVFSERLYPFF